MQDEAVGRLIIIPAAREREFAHCRKYAFGVFFYEGGNAHIAFRR